MFVVIASLVSRVVDLAARRTAEAARSNCRGRDLSTLAGSLLRGEQALPALLERVQETFAVRSVSLLRRDACPASVGAACDRGRVCADLVVRRRTIGTDPACDHRGRASVRRRG